MQPLFAVSLAFLLTVTFCVGSPLDPRFSTYALKDAHTVPLGWSKVGSPHPRHNISLQISLKQGHFEELERHLYEVSDPSHPRYGQHLSKEEVNELVKPTDDTSDLVHDWLSAHGVQSSQLSYSPARDLIKVSLPVQQVERLLDTKYSVYTHKHGDSLIRAPVWSLPVNLHKHIDTIQPTNSFFRPEALERTLKPVEVVEIDDTAFPPVRAASGHMQAVDANGGFAPCNFQNVTISCLQALYGTKDYVPRVPNNRIGMTNFLNESSNIVDTRLFLQRYRPDAYEGFGNASMFTVKSINGGTNRQSLVYPNMSKGIGQEGNLDAQTLLGMAYPIPLIQYNVGSDSSESNFKPDAGNPQLGVSTNEPYMTWLNAILEDSTLPQVISSSYGDNEQTVPQSYAVSVCNQFAQLGARGVTFLTASGDSGVGRSGLCVSNNGSNAATFLALFPASCPYVTAVGATMGKPSSNAKGYIQVVGADNNTGFYSGGGFSNYFPRPFYQNQHNETKDNTSRNGVEEYVKSLNGSFQNMYNQTGRGYPDLAASGYHHAIVWNRTDKLLDGTSCSTPTMAVIIALVNDARISNGMPPMGYLNIWLYRVGHSAFHDIKSGSAIGCGGSGFPAKRGWDAVTGWGAPSFPALKSAALAMGKVTKPAVKATPRPKLKRVPKR